MDFEGRLTFKKIMSTRHDFWVLSPSPDFPCPPSEMVFRDTPHSPESCHLTSSDRQGPLTTPGVANCHQGRRRRRPGWWGGGQFFPYYPCSWNFKMPKRINIHTKITNLGRRKMDIGNREKNEQIWSAWNTKKILSIWRSRYLAKSIVVPETINVFRSRNITKKDWCTAICWNVRNKSKSHISINQETKICEEKTILTNQKCHGIILCWFSCEFSITIYDNQETYSFISDGLRQWVTKNWSE